MEFEVTRGKYTVTMHPGDNVCAEIRYNGLTDFVDNKLHNIISRLTNNPTDIEARIEFAEFQAKQGHLEEAIQEFSFARKIDPSNIRVLMHLAVLYASESIKDYNQAQECISKVLELDPNYEDAKDLLSDVETRRDSWI